MEKFDPLLLGIEEDDLRFDLGGHEHRLHFVSPALLGRFFQKGSVAQLVLRDIEGLDKLFSGDKGITADEKLLFFAQFHEPQGLFFFQMSLHFPHQLKFLQLFVILDFF
ncbi:MAG: hypothetical protein ACD_75C00147G0001 [uncultured bacterium]|nr:MAG: hypothetical protein ACD_75C00147G0001 [uncultured bacterium]